MLIQRKEYLPGYTGHVASKQNVIGCTEGEISRQLSNKSYKFTNYTADNEAKGPMKTWRDNFSTVPPKCDDPMKKTLGNRSKEATTWIGGHTQNLRPQHIPGYAGHLPGVIAENMYSKTFGKASSEAIAGEQYVAPEKEIEHMY